MPRKKITLEEAYGVFEEHGLQVKVEAIAIPDNSELPQKTKASSTTYGLIKDSPTKVGNSTVKIMLYARHSVGSGGIMTVADGDKHIENAGVQSYGPGVSYVPATLANHLLHQDGLAKQADKRMLDREQHFYIAVPKIGPGGQRSNAGIQVNEDMLNNMGNLPGHMTYIIR